MTIRQRVAPDYEATQHDYGKTLSATLLGPDKLPVDLSDATSITMRLGREGQTPIATGAAIKNADQVLHKGEIVYTWTAGQLDTPGDFEMTFVVVTATTRLTYPTEPLVVRVKRELAVLT